MPSLAITGKSAVPLVDAQGISQLYHAHPMGLLKLKNSIGVIFSQAILPGDIPLRFNGSSNEEIALLVVGKLLEKGLRRKTRFHSHFRANDTCYGFGRNLHSFRSPLSRLRFLPQHAIVVLLPTISRQPPLLLLVCLLVNNTCEQLVRKRL